MKVSLRTLLLTVSFAAVVAAALAQPSLFWMRVMFSLAVGFLSFTLVGALRAQGQARAFWTGAAAFGIGYFALLMERGSSGFPQQPSVLSRAMISQPLLDWLAAARGLDVRSGFVDFRLWDEQMYAVPASTSGFGVMGPGMGGYSGSGPSVGGVYSVQDSNPSGTGPIPFDPIQDTRPVLDPDVSAGPSSGTGSGGPGGMIPPGTGGGTPGYFGSGTSPPAGAPPIGAPPLPAWAYGSYNHFLIAGHCAFVILIGLGGGIVCQWAFGRDVST